MNPFDDDIFEADEETVSAPLNSVQVSDLDLEDLVGKLVAKNLKKVKKKHKKKEAKLKKEIKKLKKKTSSQKGKKGRKKKSNTDDFAAKIVGVAIERGVPELIKWAFASKRDKGSGRYD